MAGKGSGSEDRSSVDMSAEAFRLLTIVGEGG